MTTIMMKTLQDGLHFSVSYVGYNMDELDALHKSIHTHTHRHTHKHLKEKGASSSASCRQYNKKIFCCNKKSVKSPKSYEEMDLVG
jgi:hypothetical protein